MNLSSELISQFVKITKDDKKVDNGSTMYGTIVEYDGQRCVKLDGSDQITPITTTADVLPGDRVAVLIKNHTATVTGNASSPSARKESVDGLDKNVSEMGSKIDEFELLVADMLTVEQLNAVQANIETLLAEKAYIADLEAQRAEIDELFVSKAEVDELFVTQAEIDELSANVANIDLLIAGKAEITDLEATNLKVNNLEATFGEFEELTTNKFTAQEGYIEELRSDMAEIDTLYAKHADIETLYAKKADVEELEADLADIDTLIFGSASGTSIHTSFANAVVAQLGDAQIKSAMIDNISADKINAGDINTNNVRVVSEDGRLIISDETIQISDATRVRVQIGKDATGDYSISIWDTDGKLMFSEGGITDNAIKEAIIRNDMVSENANIAASKLDISSLFTEINNSTETINAGRVTVDTEGQTLDVAFTSMTSDLEGLGNTVSSQGTQLSVIQGQIDSKIWQQDIDAANGEYGEAIESLTTKQSTLEQTVNGLSATVTEHTTTLTNKADSSTVTEVSNKVSELETGLEGFKSTVSSTYATKTELSTSENEVTSLKERMTDAESAISQNVEAIELRVTKTEIDETLDNYYTKDETDAALVVKADEISSTVATKIDAFEIGGRNLLRFTQNLPIIEDEPSSMNGISLYNTSYGNLEQTDDGVKLSFAENGQCGITVPLVYDGCVENGETVTLAFKYKGNITNPGLLYFIQRTTPNVSVNLSNYATLTANETEWQHFIATFHSNAANERVNYQILLFYGLADYTADNWIEIKAGSLKFEKGNKSTDWTPAPEDVDALINDGNSDILDTTIDRITEAVQTSQNYIFTALESYTKSDDLEKLRNDIKSELKIMSDNISMTFTKVEDTKTTNEKLQELQDKYDVYEKHIDFSDEGIIIKSSDTGSVLQLDNVAGVVISQNGVPQSQLVKNEFKTGNILVEVDEYAQFGGLRAEPRVEGTKKSLMWIKVGG